MPCHELQRLHYGDPKKNPSEKSSWCRKHHSSPSPNQSSTAEYKPTLILSIRPFQHWSGRKLTLLLQYNPFLSFLAKSECCNRAYMNLWQAVNWCGITQSQTDGNRLDSPSITKPRNAPRKPSTKPQIPDEPSRIIFFKSWQMDPLTGLFAKLCYVNKGEQTSNNLEVASEKMCRLLVTLSSKFSFLDFHIQETSEATKAFTAVSSPHFNSGSTSNNEPSSPSQLSDQR